MWVICGSDLGCGGSFMNFLLAFRNVFVPELGSEGLFQSSFLALGAVLFVRRRGPSETRKQACRSFFGTKISPKRPQTLYFMSVLQASNLAPKVYYPHQSRVSRFCARSVAHRQPRNSIRVWPQSGRDLGVVFGAPGAPQAEPEGQQETGPRA